VFSWLRRPNLKARKHTSYILNVTCSSLLEMEGEDRGRQGARGRGRDRTTFG